MTRSKGVAVLLLNGGCPVGFPNPTKERIVKAWIVLMLALCLPLAATAEEAEEGAAKVSYITLSPPFVGNYGLDGSPKLKVFKADISLRVTGDAAAKAVKANDPRG